jgi:hypothetical protein
MTPPRLSDAPPCREPPCTLTPAARTSTATRARGTGRAPWIVAAALAWSAGASAAADLTPAPGNTRGAGTGAATRSTCPPAPPRPGRVITVGPDEAVRSIAQAAATARDGDTVEIRAGTYVGDVAVWTQNRITLRGIGGRPLLDAGGRAAQGKGIFVIRGEDVRVEHLEFARATSRDLNGSGIRMETGTLVVCDTVFRDNEEGILTGGDPASTLEIHDSQFVGNAFAYSRGYSHALYVGRIGRLTVSGSYFTRTQRGHLLKSRARRNLIAYNRLTDGPQGTASYEIDLPDGGVSHVIGNVIAQSARTENAVLVSFGAESMSVHPENALYVAHNTLVNRRTAGCTWVRAPAGTTVRAVNNVLLGPACKMHLPQGALVDGQVQASESDFVDAAGDDFRPAAGATAWPAPSPAGAAAGLSLMPVRQYRHIAGSVPLADGPPIAGALQAPP